MNSNPIWYEKTIESSKSVIVNELTIFICKLLSLLVRHVPLQKQHRMDALLDSTTSLNQGQ